jgi:hypothetical protein
MKLSSPVFVAGDGFGFDAPWPPPGLPPFDCPFLTIFGQNKRYKEVLHVRIGSKGKRAVQGVLEKKFSFR